MFKIFVHRDLCEINILSPCLAIEFDFLYIEVRFVFDVEKCQFRSSSLPSEVSVCVASGTNWTRDQTWVVILRMIVMMVMMVILNPDHSVCLTG